MVRIIRYGLQCDIFMRLDNLHAVYMLGMLAFKPFTSSRKKYSSNRCSYFLSLLQNRRTALLNTITRHLWDIYIVISTRWNFQLLLGNTLLFFHNCEFLQSLQSTCREPTKSFIYKVCLYEVINTHLYNH